MPQTAVHNVAGQRPTARRQRDKNATREAHYSYRRRVPPLARPGPRNGPCAKTVYKPRD